MVPHQAVNAGPDGQFVYAVKDKKVVVKPVSVLFDENGSTAIQGDLAPGEQVVTDGELRLVPGSTIAVQDAKPRPAGGSRKRRGGKAA